MSENSKPRPRITVNMLNDDLQGFKGTTATQISGIHERLDTAHANVERIDRDLATARQHISELQRAKNGTTLANKRVAAMESELSRIIARLETITVTSETDPAISAAYGQETERLNKRLEDLFGRASTEVGELRDQVDTLQSTVDGHDVAIGMLEEGQNSLNTRVTDVHHRVTVLERIRDAVPWGRIALAAVVGVIAGFIWNSINFTQTYPLADGTTRVVPLDGANSVWAAVIAGVVAFGLVLGLLLVFVKTKAQEREPQHEVPPVPVAPHPVVITPSAPAGDTAPTKVLVPQGVASDTR